MDLMIISSLSLTSENTSHPLKIASTSTWILTNPLLTLASIILSILMTVSQFFKHA